MEESTLERDERVQYMNVEEVALFWDTNAASVISDINNFYP